MFTLSSSISVKRSGLFEVLFRTKDFLDEPMTGNCCLSGISVCGFETVITIYLFIRVSLFHTQRTSLESLCDHQAWEYLRELFTTKAGFRHTLYKLNLNFDVEKGLK